MKNLREISSDYVFALSASVQARDQARRIMSQSGSAKFSNGREEHSSRMLQQEEEPSRHAGTSHTRYDLRKPITVFVPLRDSVGKNQAAEAAPTSSRVSGIHTPINKAYTYSPLDNPELLFKRVRRIAGHTDKVDESSYEGDERLEPVRKSSSGANSNTISPVLRSVSHVSDLQGPGNGDLITPIEFDDHEEELQDLSKACAQLRGKIQSQDKQAEADKEHALPASEEMNNCYEDMKSLLEVSLDLKAQLLHLKDIYAKLVVKSSRGTHESIFREERNSTTVDNYQKSLFALEAKYYKAQEIIFQMDSERKEFHAEVLRLKSEIRENERLHRDRAEAAIEERWHSAEQESEEALKLKNSEVEFWRDEYNALDKRFKLLNIEYSTYRSDSKEERWQGNYYRPEMTSRPIITSRHSSPLPQGEPRNTDTVDMLKVLAQAINGNKRPTGDNMLITPTKFDNHNGQNIEDFFEDLDKYMAHNQFDEETKVDVLRKFLEGSVLTQFMDHRRAHKNMVYFEWKKFLMQRYHTAPSKTVVASELRQVSYKETDNFDKFYDRVMILCDRLQPDMPPEVRAQHLLTGIMSADLREKLYNFKVETPEELRTAVICILNNMAEVRKLKSMERAVTAVNNGVVSAVAADKGVVVEERAWVNRFGDAICADCGEVGHERRQCDSKVKLPQVYARPPPWILKVANQLRHPRPQQYPANNNAGGNNYQGRAQALTEETLN